MIKAGLPFWSGFVAFSSSVVTLWAVNAVDITLWALTISFCCALLLSVFVGAAAYGKSKIDDIRDRRQISD